MFWFRSHAASEVRWGGRKQAEGEVDDGRRSAPRASFKAFLDVVRKSSIAWADVELEAINGLQIMLREAVEKTPSEQIERSLNSAQFGGTMLQENVKDGVPKNPRIRLAHERPATLPEPVEDVLRCFKASFVVADATREDFPIVFASEAFCQSTGYSKSEAIGKGVSLLHGPDTDESEMMRFRTLQESGGMYNGRMMLYKADGTAFWNLMVGSHLTHIYVIHLDHNTRSRMAVFTEAFLYNNILSHTMLFRSRKNKPASYLLPEL